jgi:hypothetical protein
MSVKIRRMRLGAWRFRRFEEEKVGKDDQKMAAG